MDAQPSLCIQGHTHQHSATLLLNQCSPHKLEPLPESQTFAPEREWVQASKSKKTLWWLMRWIIISALVLEQTEKSSTNLTERPKLKCAFSEEHSNQMVKFNQSVGLNSVACIPHGHNRSAKSRLRLLNAQQHCRVQGTERVSEHYLHGWRSTKTGFVQQCRSMAAVAAHAVPSPLTEQRNLCGCGLSGSCGYLKAL